MVMSETKSTSVFSWADEVEKEEQEEAAATYGGRTKPNPFDNGSPTEVVLHQKGNGRALDLHLPQPSAMRHKSQNKKLRSGNISSSKPRFEGSPVCSNVAFASQIHSCIFSLRYPPKYVAGVPYHYWVSNSLNALDSQHRDFKPEKENRFHEGRKPRKLRSESATSGYRRTLTDLVQAKGEIQGEPVVHGNKPEADAASRTPMQKFCGRDSLGLPLVNQNISGDLCMDGTAFQVIENKANAKRFTRKVQDFSVGHEDNSWRDTPRHKINEETAGLGWNSKNEFEKKRSS